MMTKIAVIYLYWTVKLYCPRGKLNKSSAPEELSLDKYCFVKRFFILFCWKKKKKKNSSQAIYTVFDLITAHTPISAQSSNFVVFMLQPMFLYVLYKSICYGYSFELPQQVEAIQMSTHNICFYKDNQEQIVWKHY